MVSMGITELTTLTVPVADSTKLSGWLTACCLACTLSHCGARGVRALSKFIDRMRAPLQLGWSLSLLNRPGLILFVGESQKEGQLSTNSVFLEGEKNRLCCRAHHSPFNSKEATQGCRVAKKKPYLRLANEKKRLRWANEHRHWTEELCLEGVTSSLLTLRLVFCRYYLIKLLVKDL
jgi:hypothetical protein